jgi:serine/threonine-protein kinase
MTAISSRPQHEARALRPLRRPRHASQVGTIRVHERLSVAALGRSTRVLFGWDTRGERVVALKPLHPLQVADESAMARLRRETHLATRIAHPNVVGTLGFVRRSGAILVAMDYVPCASLAEIAAAVPYGLQPEIAATIAAGALRGMHAAHQVRAAVLPRAVSSYRVLVGEDGSTRIRGIDVLGSSVVRVSDLLDELPYAPPEQLLRRAVDVRRDVYSAAVVLWETLTGRPLFHGPTVEATVRNILTDQIPAPSRFAPEVGPELDAVVLRGLARSPGDRFESASAMADALERGLCAPSGEVARALADLDLACIRNRRSLVDAIRAREGSESTVLHIECNR